MYSCQNNFEKSSTEKKTKHTPSGQSIFTSCSFDPTKNRFDCCKGEDCMERFCKDLREHAMKTMNYKKKEMKSKTFVTHAKKIFSTDKNDKNAFKLYHKVRDHCHYTGKFRGVAHSICNLRYKTPKKIPAVFHNGSTYNYHFIINQLAKVFNGQLECLGENTEKYIAITYLKKNLIIIKQLRKN